MIMSWMCFKYWTYNIQEEVGSVAGVSYTVTQERKDAKYRNTGKV